MSNPPIVRILVVDDHPFFREGLITWISRQPNYILCGHADSPATALAATAEQKPDVVLLDLQLRDGDGFDFLRGIEHAEHRPRVIMVTHKDETIFAERSIRAGARGYVLKDEAINQMLVAIQEVLDGGIHVSEAIRRQMTHSNATEMSGPLARMRTLYNRELQVLQLLGRGQTTKEIAVALEISPKTVEYYRETLKKKLGVADSLSLVRLATIWEHDQK